MEYFLFAGYLIGVAWLITKVKFFTQSGLTKAQLIIFFLLKVMAGIFYGWIGVYYWQMAQMVDTWSYHYESLQESALLRNDPITFFTSLFRNTYEGGYTNFLVSKNSWWNDLKGTFFIKLLAIFNLLSFGNYFINIIFYSFLTMFGPVAIYRVMRSVFPVRRLSILIATFLVPSFIYWTSGLHKDGLIFVGLGLVVYHFYFGLKEEKFRFYRLPLIALGLALILAMRNFLLLPLLPCLVAWWLAKRLTVKPVIVFAGVLFLSMVIFFTAGYVHPKFNFPEAVVIKQQEFFKLGGKSAVRVDSLRPGLGSFIQNAPGAFSITTIRPYPADVRHLLSLAAAVEINLILLLVLLFVFYRRVQLEPSPFLLFCLCFSFATLMMIGYSVNVLGAIVRYRSIVFPFLVVPIVASIDWQRLKQLVLTNINKN